MTIRFHKFNTVIRTNTNQSTHTDDLQNRGKYMTEDKEKITTPVRIEFNLESTTKEFNIINISTEIFQQMSQTDPSIRILSSVGGQVLWDIHSQLPEDEEFKTLFCLREQNFRRDNMKVTIYGVVDSYCPINRMKFTDPLKSMLLEQNIWIKPDFYSTKVVSSPGFFTLFHPKINNKNDLVKQMTKI